MLDKAADKLNMKLPAKRMNFIKNQFAEVDESAEKVIKKIHKAGKMNQILFTDCTKQIKGLLNMNLTLICRY